MANKAKIPLKLAFTMGFAPGPISQGGRRWSEVVSILKSHNQELSNDICLELEFIGIMCFQAPFLTQTF